MSREEAEAFVVEALALAMARDGSSGGIIRTVTLDKDGATHRWVFSSGGLGHISMLALDV